MCDYEIKTIFGETLKCDNPSPGPCILHAPNPKKNMKAFREAVWQRIKNPVQEVLSFTSSEPVVNLAGVIFPETFDFPKELPSLLLTDARFLEKAELNLSDRKISGDIHADRLVSVGTINFHATTIGGDAYFREASIGKLAYFGEASIGKNAYFSEASIGEDAYFGDASIGWGANFRKASIGGNADFGDASIGGDLDFDKASIGKNAYFKEASIGEDADFGEASIGENIVFDKTSIGRSADFREASIGEHAYFFKTSIGEDADFSGASISGNAYFSEASIVGNTYFTAASIVGNTYFRAASIGGNASFIEASIGKNAYFRKASIGGDANFREASIGWGANFSEASIGGYADFTGASIGRDANFREASIGEDADFGEASIGENIVFDKTSIGRSADFREASIGEHAYFFKTSIGEDALLDSIRVYGVLNLSLAELGGRQLFSRMVLGGLRIEENMIPIQIYNSCFAFADLTPRSSIRLTGCSPDISSKAGENPHQTQASVWSDLLAAIEFGEQSPEKILNAFRNTGIFEASDSPEKKIKSIHEKYPWLEPFIEEKSLSGNTKKGFIARLRYREKTEKKLAKGLEQLKKRKTSEVKDKDEEKEEKKVWNFTGRNLAGLSLVECDLQVADFRSSDLDGVYFDSCKWPTPDGKNYTGIVHHTEALENLDRATKSRNKKEKDSKAAKEEYGKAREDLIKLRNVYHRLKKNFEANQDYRQAGDFHYREMELRRKIERKWMDRIMLFFYGGLLDFGESYIKGVLYLLGTIFLFPWIPVLFSNLTYEKFYQTFDRNYLDSLSYFTSAVFPKVLGNAVGVKQQSAEEFLCALGFGTDFWMQVALLIGLGIFYIMFFALLTLTLMSIRRRFRR